MASCKMCLDCDRFTFATVSDARAHGWVSLLVDRWNDLWRCPWCNEKQARQW